MKPVRLFIFRLKAEATNQKAEATKMTTTRSRSTDARPAKPGIWLVLLFVFVSGMAFSSSAETDPSLRSAVAAGVTSRPVPVPLMAAIPTAPWTTVREDEAVESLSLAFLGVALIGAAGCWRRVIRRRQHVARTPAMAASHPAPVPHLRAVPRQRMAS